MTYFTFYKNSETFEKFIVKSLEFLEPKIKVIEDDIKGLVNPDFDNILCLSGYEVSIKRFQNTYQFNLNKIPSRTKLEIKFGCELETCFVINCKGKEVIRQLKNILKITDNDNLQRQLTKESDGFLWARIVLFHLRTNIIPDLTENFLNKFTYAFIFESYHNKTGIYIDLKTGEILATKLPEDSYKTLIFEPDGSIQCDIDSEDTLPISCEIVTPILNSIEDLKLLYEGIVSKTCNQSNKSMGFHVNISAVKRGETKPITLTDTMLMELVYTYLPYEKKFYKDLRGENSYYAPKLKDYLNDKENFLKVQEKVLHLNNEPIDIDEYYTPYGLAIQELVTHISKVKQLAITNHKKINVIEFRVFPSKNNIETLIQYTQDAINIFQTAMNNYCKNARKILSKIQSQNLLYKDITSEGPFTYKEFTYNELIHIQIFKNILWYNKKNFFGKKTKKYFHIWNLYKYTDYKIYAVLSFDIDEKLQHYVYEITYVYNTEEEKYVFSNPRPLTNEEFKEIRNETDY